MSLLHGWPGLLSAYVAVEAPMLAAMARARAPLPRILATPLTAVPVTALAGGMLAAAAPALGSVGALGGTVLGIAAAVTATAALGYASGMVLGRAGPPASLHRRGALVTGEDVPPSAARRRVRTAGAPGVTLAGVRVPEADEVKHFKLIGTTGTGKSTAIHELLSAALARGDRCVIADPDVGYLRSFYDRRRGDVILNPFDARSARWDLFAELGDDYDVEQLARSLIPDHEGADRSWRGYARTFFSAVTAQAHAAGSRDVRELYRLLVVAGTQELKTLVAGTPAQPFLEEHNGRMFESIRSVTSSAVGALDYIAAQDAHATAFSVREGVRGGGTGEADSASGGVLFIPYQAGQIAALRSPISAWM